MEEIEQAATPAEPEAVEIDEEDSYVRRVTMPGGKIVVLRALGMRDWVALSTIDEAGDATAALARVCEILDANTVTNPYPRPLSNLRPETVGKLVGLYLKAEDETALPLELAALSRSTSPEPQSAQPGRPNLSRSSTSSNGSRVAGASRRGSSTRTTRA